MSKAGAKKRINRGAVKYFDYYMVGLVMLLLAFGLVMLFSASSYTASMRYGSAMFFVKKQLIYTVLGFCLMLFCSKIDYHHWIRLSYPIYFVSVILCIWVIFNGSARNNSARWIDLKIITVQPSEIAKIACILLNAYFISRVTFRNRKMEDRLKVLAKCMVPTVIATFLVAISNLSTALIIVMLSMIMYFVAYPKSRIFILMFLFIAFVGVLFLSLASYRSTRLKIWHHPENFSEGYQTMQGLYAIGSGGIFGKGLGASLQKKFVPEAQNDMIFTLICEELGLIGAIVVIMMYILLLYRMYRIAHQAEDKAGSFIAIGVMAHVALQVLLNIAVATNSIPNTGVTLPFISYGGSSLWMMMYELGVVLNVSRSTKFEV
ncbi:MAG: putative lipid II flippase FtsW [Lachnospiraceae bacterium]|nr:putative lipid II flippase FtsW [Lachnospiraceae bacterium]